MEKIMPVRDHMAKIMFRNYKLLRSNLNNKLKFFKIRFNLYDQAYFFDNADDVNWFTALVKLAI
jgi:hypothetical protein